MQICGVCSEQAIKYRCPGCRVRYCSLGCYKRHKGDACLYAVQTPELGDSSTTDVRASNTGQTKSNADGTPWSVDSLLCEDIIDRVPLPKLQLLGQSKELKDLLSNPHLRRLLRSVDTAESKDNAMKTVMQEPLFVEFADRCLNIVQGDGQ
ncbi:zinc finger HIT domain-containing protein 3 [Cynoglossus semilaevis]|uniref:Zinc finger HIT domain-containing protein 3 n=1 Tax=Cynoglossus semilaevis TaxID=244447 RepID=A0A3P8WFC9_CYNSE|nr:zinc finger HIT domain-containing protein 3 [Cynoglossus semilaevis]